MHVPPLVIDLAIMLMTAGIVTIIFKKLRLPLILGYIVVGFLASPYFPMFFGVSSKESISALSEIGVIIILFHIGLEFDIHKLGKMGSTAIISAIVKISGTMLVGYVLGKIFGMTSVESLFLGAMISISSTVVIKKCFEDIKEKGKYMSLVMGSLIIEDIIAVILMVILGTVSISKNINGSALLINLSLMGIYLIAWLLLGIFILPTFLNRVINLMSDEMKIVLSLGICFSMSLIANALGFSMELGAFLAGSFFAGTVHGEDIEHLTSGIKDLFGTVFFISVGTMVNPNIILKEWKLILLIVVLAIISKLIFGIIGMLLSGQDINTAVSGGVSLAPIGEFSFIIATFGISLEVMSDYMYPVIVVSSIATIILTPFLINKATGIVNMLYKITPKKISEKLFIYTSETQSEEEKTEDWRILIKSTFKKILLYGTIMLTIALSGIKLLAPILINLSGDLYGKIFACIFIYIGMTIFIKPILDFHNIYFTHLWLSHNANRPPLVVITVFKFAIIAFISYMPLYSLFGAYEIVPLILILIIILIIGKSKFIATSYLQLETRFLRNLNEKIIADEESKHGKRKWLDEDFNIISFFAEDGGDYVGKSLIELGWGKSLNIYIVKIKRNGKDIIMPSASCKINQGDKIYAIGEYKSIETFYKVIKIEPRKKIRTLKEFMNQDYDGAHALSCLAIRVFGMEPYIGKPIRNTNIQSKGKCMILGIQKSGVTFIMPDVNMRIEKDDILWIIGSNNNVGKMLALGPAFEK